MKGSRLRLIILAFLLLCAVLSIFVLYKENRNGLLKVVFLDVGQGDAIYIEAPNGNQILIDGGPSKAVLRELSKVMPFYDRSIDVVLATHADQDHVGGLPDVISNYNVGLFLEPGVPSDSSSYVELKGKIENLKIKRLEARRGMDVDLGDGAVLQILFPDRDPTGMETNTSSVVTRLVYGENEFLLTGDSPTAIENYLVSLGGLPSDVLKAGHHGSKTSTSVSFVSVVSPEYAVISAGKDNKYGHPNQETIDTLTNFGAKILRTDQSGRIIFKSDGVNLKIK
ncbi:MAG: MBL fold metallo-hydrolase [Patescibacteria group bacterium]